MNLEVLLDKLDLTTMVRLLTGAAMFELHGEPAVGLAPLVFSDGPSGVRGPVFSGGRPVALLPNATLIASTWDTRVAHGVGVLLAEEARAQGVHVVLGPTVNLHRTPLGGRLFEAFSEDPLLTGALATEYVRGLQENGVAACPKHFVANESETDRMTVNSRVADRVLREVYLLPFEMLVADAEPWAIMAAYNDVNGVPATEHGELLDGVLKGEWAFDGLVMSDWFATKSTTAAANGLDLVMPGPAGPWGDALITAVRAGEVGEDAVRDHVRRLLRLASRVGGPGPAVDPADPVRRDHLRSVAAAGMTVLTGGEVIPFEDSPVLLVGRHALRTVAQGGGSAQVRPPHVVSVADGLRAALGDRLTVLDGVEVRATPEVADPSFVSDPETGAPGIRVTSRQADGSEQASTHQPVPSLLLDLEGGPHDGAASVVLSADLPLTHTGEVEVGVIGTGRWTVRLGDHHHEITLDTTDVGSAVLDPPHWTVRLAATPGSRLVATRRPPDEGAPVGLAALVARPAPAPDDDVIGAAAAAATGAARAVVVVGLTPEQEMEAKDKTTLALPGRQDDLVRAVAAAARSTVVVVNAATPVLMPWLDDVDAVLWAGLPGQEGGHAVADVLLGRREATGRLVTTFPAADGAGPAWSPVPVDGVLDYTEGLGVGYRGWTADTPLFWFGHGLGWTTWAYHDAEPGGPDALVVTIENTGTRTGREVVQVYLRPDDDPVRLAGWAVADDVAPGERRAVRVTLDPRALRRWTSDGWAPLPGGRLVVARGLGDVRLDVARPAPAAG
ncbi:glycoside hydrolase family 3 C-terminal domain-containing protein [Amycolatopsis sp. NPDC051758]|uniref:glycoside hydrolase family 3 protein n=1 Tax=Amycolatopsis sp. NPDC051758 TaxID=3363935 RepID=UPI0037AA3F29